MRAGLRVGPHALMLPEMVAAACAVTVLLLLALAPARVGGFPVATSLNGMSSEPALLELFKYSRHFGSWKTPWDENCTVDETNGWPTQNDFGVVIDWEPVPAAKMAFSATCGAEPTVQISGVQLEGAAWDSAANVYTALAVTPASFTSLLFLSFRNTSGGCTRISLMQPGAKPSIPGAPTAFSPTYIAAVEQFAHLRMMDWGQTNGNPIAQWSERTPVDWPSYRYGRTVPSRGMDDKQATSSNTGAPYEVMLDLCNEARVDCWINIPALVNDDFIAQLAALAKARLRPDLNLYLEYSNELWNDMFAQSHWNYNMSNHSVIDGDPLSLNYDNQTLGEWTCVNWSYRRTAYMLMRIGQLFGTVFGSHEVPNGRVRPVLAGQEGDTPQWEGLQYLQNVHGNPSDFIHATANAPYFAMNSSSAGRTSPNCEDGWTATQVLDMLEAQLHKPESGYIASRDVKNAQAVSAAHALWYQVRVLTYEGGPDTSCFFANPSSVPGKLMANLDPRMQQIAFDYLQGHAAHGQHYGALNWFVCCASGYDSIYGQWGISNNLANFSHAPKWLGIKQALAAPMPVPALGVPVPGVVNGSSDAVGRVLPNDLFCGAVDTLYVLNSKAGGKYALQVDGRSSGGNLTLTIGVNGRPIGTAEVGSDQSAPVDVSGDGVTLLKAGVSALRITMPGTPHRCIFLSSIIVKHADE
jgi:hypothetical protein